MYFVYLLASRKHGTLYIGVTNDLRRRMEEHCAGQGAEFTRKHAVYRLVYFKPHERIDGAIAREKQLKGWNRAWKIRLVERSNPEWEDVGTDIPLDA